MLSDAELDKIIADAPFEVELLPERTPRIFANFRELASFYDEELRFWEATRIGRELSNPFSNIANPLRQAKQSLTERDARNQIDEARRCMREGTLARTLVYSQTAHAGFLTELAARSATQAKGAFQFLRVGNATPQQLFADQDTFVGFVAALLFCNPKLLSGSVEAEIKASSEQRNDITNYREDVANWVRTLKADIGDWKTNAETGMSKLMAENEKDFKQEHETQSSRFEELVRAWEQKVSTLEATYNEKLRLADPAKYWAKLEKRYVRQGRFWIVGATLIVVALAGWVSVLVYQPPGVLLVEKFTLSGLRGTLLIVGGISASVYLINVFVKIATSSYHLARDARERYQLTHVFLALIKDSAIEAKEREIILSALFSRSDTGLLKGDTGPIHPGIAVIENIFKQPR